METSADAYDQSVQLRKMIHAIDDVLNASISSRRKARCLRGANSRMVEELLLAMEEEGILPQTESQEEATEKAPSTSPTTSPSTGIDRSAPQLRLEALDFRPPSEPAAAGYGQHRTMEESRQAAVSSWLRMLPDCN